MTAAQFTYCKIRDDPAFNPLKQLLIEKTGLAYYGDKEEELASHICHRLNALGNIDCAAYLGRLLDGHVGEAEMDTLAARLTIGETFFFRHRELFDALRNKVFPELIKRNKEHRRLRLWSAGCAIGAEAYSLSILLRREFAAQLEGWEISIIGTDINRDFLATAQSGEFGEWSFRSSPDELKNECFTRTGSIWSIKEEYRQGVAFQYHNLVQHPFPSLVNNLSAFDLILCRNVMIYFDSEIVRHLVAKFRDCLVDEGWFVVGHSEPNVDLYREFRTVNAAGVVLYQRSKDLTPPSTCPDWNAWTPPSFPLTDDARTVVPFLTSSPTMTSTASAMPTNEKVGASLHAPHTPQTKVQFKLQLKDIRLRLDHGEWESAAMGCQQMEFKERLNPIFHFYQALLNEQLGKHAETEAALRRAIYLDRNFVLAHYYLGLVLQRMHYTHAALRCFRNVLSLLENSEEADILPEADGLTVGELQRLSQMHQEVLQHS